MIKSIFKLAWRNLLKNKGLSFINIFGLAIGLAFAMLVGFWIQYETSFDKFHQNIGNLALIRKNTLFNNEKNTQLGIPLPVYDELKAKYPEIKRASRLDWASPHSLMVGNEKFKKTGLYVDPDFLKMFSFPMVKGDLETALNDPHSVVLSESLARTLFGDQNPIGKAIRLDNEFAVQVSAIIKDVPKNSTLQFDFLAPFEFKVQNFDWVREAKTQWSNNFLMNMVELREGSSIQALSKKISQIMIKKDPENNKNQTLFLQPMSQWHLRDEYKNWMNDGGRIDYVRLFGMIGIFVLLIACINFMNLATARSEKRAREVGIRKAVGSKRIQLILQFLGEAMLTTFFAFLVSLGILYAILPFLKTLGLENINIDFLNLPMLTGALLVCAFTGLVAGSYPALYLSSFLPVKVLKGIFKQGKGPFVFRKVLVVFQFTISIALIVSTIIVFRQIEHARSRSIGYDPNNLISIGSSGDLVKNYNALKQELLNTGYAAAISKASSPMTAIYNSWSDFSWEGKDPSVMSSWDVVMTEWDYEKTAGLRFIEGRPFNPAFKTDSNGVVLNEAALKMIGYKDPVGKTIKLGEQTLTITGIIQNVVMQNPFKPVSPTAIIWNQYNVSNIFIRLKAGVDLRKALASIKPVVERNNPSLPFEYKFVDEEFQEKFTEENQVAKLAGIFAVLAIFISCLGLFGLAAFMTERRVKEIGVRKVLGASVTDLWILLSKEFVLLVLTAFLIASPIAYYLMKNWLQKYDYRIDIGWWVFLMAGSLALIIAILTVSSQAVRAALRNPVRSLRNE